MGDTYRLSATHVGILVRGSDVRVSLECGHMRCTSDVSQEPTADIRC
jgi:hypothetical protein